MARREGETRERVNRLVGFRFARFLRILSARSMSFLFTFSLCCFLDDVERKLPLVSLVVFVAVGCIRRTVLLHAAFARAFVSLYFCISSHFPHARLLTLNDDRARGIYRDRVGEDTCAETKKRAKNCQKSRNKRKKERELKSMRIVK